MLTRSIRSFDRHLCQFITFSTNSPLTKLQKMAISTTPSPPQLSSNTKQFQLPKINPALPKDFQQKSLITASHDFRSDTITVPTSLMSKAMFEAGGGDNVYEDDLITIEFEKSISSLFGKESGLFVPTGTLSNQLCLRTWLHQPPFSIICDRQAHIHKYEAGGCAFHSGAAIEAIKPSNGLYLTWKDIEEEIIPDDGNTHCAPTRIVSLENTLNGVIVPQEEIETISKNLKEKYPQIKLHLDGARIWHVAIKTGLSLEQLCKPFDSVSVCFSKGLGAPIGSMMLGPKTFIKKATHFRKLFGAGMRQVGVISSAAKVALEETYYKLDFTHSLATWLAEELKREGIKITKPVDTSMVWFDPTSIGISIEKIIERGSSLPDPFILNGNRVVIHHQTNPKAVQDLVNVIRQLKSEKSTTN